MRRPLGYITSHFAGTEGYRTSPHLGTDFVLGFKSAHVAVGDGFVYKTRNKDNADLQKYRTVYQVYNGHDGLYEIVYEHLWDILVDKGEIVLEGEPIGTEGNTGDLVFYGGVKVRPEEKPTGKGHHLHIQGRPLIKVKKTKSKTEYLKNLNGTVFKDADGYAYEAGDWIDLEPLFVVPTVDQFIHQVSKVVGYLRHKLG